MALWKLDTFNGATPLRQLSIGNGTRMEPLSVLPNGGGGTSGIGIGSQHSAEVTTGSHSHSPFRFCHHAGSPVSRNESEGTDAVRTICGRGYFGSGVVSAETWSAHFVGRSMPVLDEPHRVRCQVLESGRRGVASLAATEESITA